jgi:hypothetical protein
MTDCFEVKYGDSSDQFYKLFPPLGNEEEPNNSKPIVILIHGGFWKQKYSVSNALIDKLTPFFQEKSFWVCLVEYRRGNVNDGGCGGWPFTNEDMILALNSLKSYVAENNSKFLSTYHVSTTSYRYFCNSWFVSVQWIWKVLWLSDTQLVVH